MTAPLLTLHRVRPLVQGITGREAAMVVQHALAYGTKIVAGVTPGRGGQQVHGVPVFDTVEQAIRSTGANASLISVPPAGLLDAGLEAISAGLDLLVVVTERVPQHDALKLIAAAQQAKATLIGPNCTGLIAPAQRLKLGSIGGDRPQRCFAPGRVAVVSRSGGMTAECAWMVQRAGTGVSLAVSVGGDGLIGTPPAAVLAQLEEDPATAAAVLWGEPGTNFEEAVAELLMQRGFTKPLIAHVAGRFVEEQPAGTIFGHAAALVRGRQGRPLVKIERLRAAGAHIADRLDDLPHLLRHQLD
jgi:succinyl-CoA synthetase alpha subunit